MWPADLTLCADLQEGRLQILKDELNSVKSKLDSYNLNDWHRHTRAMNKAGEIQWRLRKELEPELLTQVLYWSVFILFVRCMSVHSYVYEYTYFKITFEPLCSGAGHLNLSSPFMWNMTILWTKKNNIKKYMAFCGGGKSGDFAACFKKFSKLFVE
jgi:hypothetical protein